MNTVLSLYNADPVSITSLDLSSAASLLFTLNCTSSGSPATTVAWRKYGALLSESGVYQISQILYSSTTSTYFNLLAVDVGPYGVIGDYSCEVSNILGSVTRNATFSGQFSDDIQYT